MGSNRKWFVLIIAVLLTYHTVSIGQKYHKQAEETNAAKEAAKKLEKELATTQQQVSQVMAFLSSQPSFTDQLGRAIPRTNDGNDDGEGGLSHSSQERFKSRAPDEALEELKDKCFITQQGRWSYEFCSHNKLRQFHVENGRVVEEFVLGEYDAEATAAHKRTFFDTLTNLRWRNPSRRYHAHIYTHGTKCDPTNEPRETEVRFECSEPNCEMVVDEFSTCKYTLTIRCKKDIP